jgi:DNA-binding transcriptional regulator YiaG
MTERRFAPRCGKCHQKSKAIVAIDYRIQRDHDGKKYQVHIPALTVPKCMNPECGEISFDDVACEQIDRAFRATAGLLTPEEIRIGRIRLGFDQQQEFAQCLGIAVSTLSRWETGAQIQQHFHDGILRAFFAVPQLRAFLAALRGVKPLPRAAVNAQQLPMPKVPAETILGRLIHFASVSPSSPIGFAELIRAGQVRGRDLVAQSRAVARHANGLRSRIVWKNLNHS